MKQTAYHVTENRNYFVYGANGTPEIGTVL